MPAGSHVAIVGPTGCGKTTLINLLMRFYEINGGTISIDGKDTRSMSKHFLRENIGMVLQETWLADGTVRENIAFGKPDASDEEIVKAAKAAHAHGFIRRLPNGYDTKISSDASDLSEGRSAFRTTPLLVAVILILDVATTDRQRRK